jgi:hypothetical protein
MRTLLPLTNLDAGNLAAIIGVARTQISNISARLWTPVGAGIDAAKDQPCWRRVQHESQAHLPALRRRRKCQAALR